MFRWLRDKPPALAAVATQDAVTGDIILNGYNRSCELHADTFGDIWCCSDAPSSSWPAKLGEADWLPVSDVLRSQAMSFPRGTSYGSDGMHPRQVAPLSDALL